MHSSRMHTTRFIDCLYQGRVSSPSPHPFTTSLSPHPFTTHTPSLSPSSSPHLLHHTLFTLTMPQHLYHTSSSSSPFHHTPFTPLITPPLTTHYLSPHIPVNRRNHRCFLHCRDEGFLCKCHIAN